MKISAFSFPIIIKEKLGEIFVSAPDWGIFIAVSKPTSGGLLRKTKHKKYKIFPL